MKEYKMSNEELVAYLVSSLTKNPRKDMSIAINEIVERMNSAKPHWPLANWACECGYVNDGEWTICRVCKTPRQ